MPGFMSTTSQFASSPSHNFTKPKSKVCGFGTYRSRRGAKEADEVELRDRKVNSLTPDVNGRLSNGFGDEHHSERIGVRSSGSSNQRTAIMKTISVTVTNEDSNGADGNRDGGISRCEQA
jgi:hypothetical protein